MPFLSPERASKYHRDRRRDPARAETIRAQERARQQKRREKAGREILTLAAPVYWALSWSFLMWKLNRPGGEMKPKDYEPQGLAAWLRQLPANDQPATAERVAINDFSGATPIPIGERGRDLYVPPGWLGAIYPSDFANPLGQHQEQP